MALVDDLSGAGAAGRRRPDVRKTDVKFCEMAAFWSGRVGDGAWRSGVYCKLKSGAAGAALAALGES